MRPSSLDQEVDIGIVAEAMVFYQNVELFVGEATLQNLVVKLGVDAVSDLVTSRYLKLTLLADIPATHHNTQGGFPVYDFVTVTALRRDGTERDIVEVLRSVLERATGKRGKSRRIAHRLGDVVGFRKIGDDIPDPTGVSGLARRDLADVDFVTESIKDVIRARVPLFSIPAGMKFSAQCTSAGIVIDTNLDFEALNAKYRNNRTNNADVIEASHLIGWIQDARVDAHLASQKMAELGTNEVAASIIRRKLGNLVKSSGAEDIGLFTEVVLQNEAKTIREAMNSGERSVSDLLKLVEEAKKFREWLSELPDDSNLVREYIREISHRSWSERLPTKVVRFFLFASAGVASTLLPPAGGVLAGIGLTAVDDLLLDKLVSGWKPSQFITGELAKFSEVRKAS